MIVRMGLLNRRPELSPEAFTRYWREVHGPLAARMPNLRRYEQNVVIDRSQLAIDHARGAMDLDGFSQLWFDDPAAMDDALASPEFDPVIPDNDRFVGRIGVLVAQPNVVIPVEEGPLIKRMSLLRRHPDIDAQQFRREWFGFHAEAVSRFPRIAGYIQNLVVTRGSHSRVPAAYDELPIDGVVEMWFRNRDDLNAAFASPAAEVSQSHAKDFIAEITTFLVEPYRVV